MLHFLFISTYTCSVEMTVMSWMLREICFLQWMCYSKKCGRFFFTFIYDLRRDMEIYLLCKQKCNSSCCLPQLCSLTIVTTLFASANPCAGVHPECRADFYRIMEWFPVKHLGQVYCYFTYCHVLNPAPHSCSLYCCQNQPRCKRWHQKMGSIYAWLYK